MTSYVPDAPLEPDYPDERKYGVCPICGESNLYIDEVYTQGADVIGCNECVEVKHIALGEVTRCPVCDASDPESVCMRDGEIIGCGECVSVAAPDLEEMVYEPEPEEEYD